MRQVKLFEDNGYTPQLEKEINTWLRENATLTIIGFHMTETSNSRHRTIAIEYVVQPEQPIQ